MSSSLSFEDTISIERDLSYTMTMREFHIKGDVVKRSPSFRISGQIRKYLQQSEGGLSSYAADSRVKVKADPSSVRIIRKLFLGVDFEDEVRS